MAKIELNINDKVQTLEVDEQKPLLWVLRDELGLTGTKYGCGVAQCGACTVHLNEKAVRSCIIPVGSIGENKITTIEGIAKQKDHPVLKAWEVENVPQCGYCQTGQIMTATALLNDIKNPTDRDIDGAMSGNFCRCGTYYRIRKAIKRAVSDASD